MSICDKIGYGFRGEQLVHVSQVDRGLACGCVCVACLQPLVAKKGDIKEHHFAHQHNAECLGAAETALHLLSKELFAHMKSIAVPRYEFRLQREVSRQSISVQALVLKGGVASIDSARTEQRKVGFVPDVILQCGPKSLIVEIAVTHKVERNKLRHIRRNNVPAIEIQLAPTDALLSRDDLREKLQHDLASKAWLFHPKQREAELEFFRKLRLASANSRAARERFKVAVNRGSRNVKPAKPDANWAAGSPLEADRLIFQFLQQHHRCPTAEECFKLWPQHWTRPGRP